jgi:hypothetical protein
VSFFYGINVGYCFIKLEFDPALCRPTVLNISHIFGEGDKHSHILYVVVKHPKMPLMNLYVSKFAMQEVVHHVVEWVVLKSFAGPRTLG